jgi:transposase-like protein
MKDPSVEQWLERKKIAFTDREVSLSAINDDGKARLNIRLGEALNQERVDEYAGKMSNGEQFPAPILKAIDDTNTYIIIAGQHRIAAKRQIGQSNTDAYVLPSTIDPDLTEYLQRASNVLNGFGLEPEHREEHALHLCLKPGADVTATCREFGVSADTIRGRISARRCDERAAELAPELGKRVADLAQGARIALATLKPDDVFRDAIRLAVQARLSTPVITKLASDLRKLNSDEDRRARLKNEQDKHKEDAPATQGGQHRPSKARRASGQAQQLGDRALEHVDTALEGRVSPKDVRTVIAILRKQISAWQRALKGAEAQLQQLESEQKHGSSKPRPSTFRSARQVGRRAKGARNLDRQRRQSPSA